MNAGGLKKPFITFLDFMRFAINKNRSAMRTCVEIQSNKR